MAMKNLFSLRKNKKGMVGIQYSYMDGVIAVISHSPYASARSREWLEQEILKAYNRYYRIVCRESMGEFVDEKFEPIMLTKEAK